MSRRAAFEQWVMFYCDGTERGIATRTFDKLSPLIEALEKMSCPEVSEKILTEQYEYTSERSFGNYDDVFNDGCDSAWAGVALELREVLNAFDKGIERKE